MSSQSIVVLSLKGGVGKTHSTANIARALKRKGQHVAAIDCDYRAPNLPIVFGLDGSDLLSRDDMDHLIPPVSIEGIPVFSLYHFWPPHQAVMVTDETAMEDVRQILSPGVILWPGGDPKYLILDTPPDSVGTVAVALRAPNLLGGVIVCQPSMVSLADAERTVSLMSESGVPIFGVIANQIRTDSGEVLFDRTIEDVESFARRHDLPKVWPVPHSRNVDRVYDDIVADLLSLTPKFVVVQEPPEGPWKAFNKLSKMLSGLKKNAT